MKFAYFLPLSLVAAATVLLQPPGPPIELGTATAELTDFTRTNTFGNNSDPRTIQISVFYPLGHAPCSGGYLAQYVPQVVSDFERNYFSARGVLSLIDYASFRLQFYQKCHGRGAEEDYPVVVFGPGYLRTRLLYGALAQSVAKSGYIVVTVDHPYDADIVLLESGKVVYGVDDSNFTAEDYQPAVDTRVADLEFLLNTLSNSTAVHALLPSLPCKLNVEKVGMYGHSLGGAALANAMLIDERIVGGINLDGSLFPPFDVTDSSWNSTWPLLSGWHAELSLTDSRHSTYGDLAYLVKTLNLTHTGNESAVVGTIDGGVAMVDIRTAVVDFFDWVLKGKKRSKLLDGDDTGYPDFTWVGNECTSDNDCE